MITKTVKAGEPIKASWANDLLAEVYKPNGTYTPTTNKTIRCRTNTNMANDAAFAIRYSYGTYTINAGSIYINNFLISPPNNESENSYNMFSSIKKWELNNKYVQSEPNDVPIWYITITYPSVVTLGNVSQCEAELVIKHLNLEEPQQPLELPTGYRWKCIKVNTVLKDEESGYKHLRQLISGSIYISQNIPSIILGDGISIKLILPDVLEISSNGGGTTIVQQGLNIQVTKVTNSKTNTTTYTVHTNTVSLILGDGINILAQQYGRTTTYTISVLSTILPDFDPEWFIVRNNVVTFNTEKLIQLAEDIAATATVNVNVTGIVDEVKTGSVQVDTTGIQNGTVTTNVGII